MTHGVVRLDKVQASYNGNMEHIVHTADLDNGSFVHVGALKAGEREIKNAVVPTTATLKQEVVLIAAPEVIYDGSQGKQLDKFFTPAGKAARAYHLVAGDIITISDDMIAGTTKVDEYVVPQDGSVKLAAVATDDGSTRFVAKVIAKEIFGSPAKPVSVIQVLNS